MMQQKSRLTIPSLRLLWAEAAARSPQVGHDECRQALTNLFLAVSKAYIECPKIPLARLTDPPQAESLDYRRALYQAYHDERINQAQALEAAVQAISTRVIAQEPGVAAALVQARRALMEVRR